MGMKTYEEKVNDLFCGRLKGWALMDMETGKIVYEHIINESDMKDNLLPFDLEEAKKDPSRIRHKDGSKPEEVHIFETGDLAIVWEGIKWATVYNHKNDYQYLRLTPKRRFVKLEEPGKYNKYIELTREEAIGCQKWGAKVFELIPVKEDE